MARVLLVGSGGREHAIAHTLSKSDKVASITVSPGNAGTQILAKTNNETINLKVI